ncbi:O-methyltransferase family 2 protein [Heterostelium album PN500]|uniref:O-methyltransferase family 2 protein n=1 Tax=Heterostelium pallidum (strain ATCC 26659 / Pp 5 / PN500) TaxID=670386 RepID=D3BQI9_HETP5|nr:O-methyltransferase family 2 protein [Heterostelium album PN500]EFA76409.1 O-methyltransferase family 2 protein [Heterostelium album PN500]|eukprot:XP_020428541.1 O-methyltransferase family 2 protein [Heterostelium album PN500]
MSKPSFEIVKQVYTIMSGVQRSKALEVCTKLRIAEHIAPESSKSVGDLSKELKVHEDTLYRFMRALTSMSLFQEEEITDTNKTHGIFKHTPMSLCLRDQGVRDMVLMRGSPGQVLSWNGLFNSVKTGRTNHQESLNYPDLWEYLKDHKEEEVLFSKAMTGVTNMFVPVLLSFSDYSKFEKVVDLGGGQGLLLKNILANYPNIKEGINFDIKSVIENNSHGENLDKRYTDQSGDFFVSVPESDCYVLKSIIHDWNDECAVNIFKTISKSIRPGGKIYVYDLINDLNLKNEKNQAGWNDIHMLMVCNGKERTPQDWEYLAKHSGFKIDEIRRHSTIPNTLGLTIFSKI